MRKAIVLVLLVLTVMALASSNALAGPGCYVCPSPMSFSRSLSH